MSKKRKLPIWWDWDLELTPHLFKRMLDRGFNELDLRLMLQRAFDYRPDVVEGRWILSTRYREEPWEVIVEPDIEIELNVVITAYRVWETGE